MSRGASLKRKSFFVDEGAIRRVRKLLGAASEAEAIRMAVARVAEMEVFWRMMKASRKALKPGNFSAT